MTLKSCRSPWQPKPLQPRTTPEWGLEHWEQLALQVDAVPLQWALLSIVWLLHKNHDCRFSQEQLQSSMSPSALTAQDEAVAKEN